MVRHWQLEPYLVLCSGAGKLRVLLRQLALHLAQARGCATVYRLGPAAGGCSRRSDA